MDPITAPVATLAVAVIFYVHRAYREVLARRQRQLRERVTYMLWVMADQTKGSREVVSV